jgi:flotillin
VRQAELAAQKLEAEVRRPADAEAYRLTTLAKAEAEAAKVRADAAAHVERTTAEGQADANKARAASLREGNQELIAANHLIEILPSLVEAAARGLSDSQLTILNGTEGVNEVVAGLVGQGLTILNTLKSSPAITANGSALVKS